MPHNQAKSRQDRPGRDERLGFRIDEHQTLSLSNRDREAFFNALVNPPAPSDRLQRALAEHKRRVAP